MNKKGRTTRKEWQPALKKLNKNILILPKGCYFLGSIDFLKTCRRHFRKIYYIEHLEANRMPEKSSRYYLRGLIKGLGLWWYKKI